MKKAFFITVVLFVFGAGTVIAEGGKEIGALIQLGATIIDSAVQSSNNSSSGSSYGNSSGSYSNGSGSSSDIIITLGSSDTGTLEYGNIRTTCWYDPNPKQPWLERGKTYSGQAWPMETKGRNAIIIYGNGIDSGRGIFIHKGTGSSWSSGCIVIDENQLESIYNSIGGKGNYVNIKIR